MGFFYQVVKGGAADRAGVEDEDIVVEVNGVYVEKSTHEEVVNLIRKSGDRLVLLVAGKTAYDHLRAQGVTITPQLLDEEPSADIPKPASAQEEETKEQHQDNESDKETEKTATPPRSRVRNAFRLLLFSGTGTVFNYDQIFFSYENYKQHNNKLYTSKTL